jgi:hypothetical protein
VRVRLAEARLGEGALDSAIAMLHTSLRGDRPSRSRWIRA